MAAPLREVRFGLVLNGGVSLAIWIGGVTKEIDALRRASEAEWPGTHPPIDAPEGTGACYQQLLQILRTSVLVDVIAGSSAGGLNGVLLAAAIANGKPLPNLRDTWISLGDLRTLLRSPSEKDPPSLLQGDRIVLPTLSRELDRLYEGGGESRQDRLYLYVTATDLTGTRRRYRDSTGRKFTEVDPRQRFDFELVEESNVPLLPPRYDLKAEGTANALARAGRATASFPAAFEPHLFAFGNEDHRLMDGGVLDNQPFRPVLDRIGVLPAATPVKRVVGYVVPYVNEPPKSEKNEKQEAKEETRDVSMVGAVWASGSLPRELPKLDSLDRVTRDLVAVQTGDRDRDRLIRLALESPDKLRSAAAQLFAAYRETRVTESWRVFAAWDDDSFEAGSGVLAQDPAQEPQGLPWEPYERTRSLIRRKGPWLPPEGWTPDDGIWPASRRWIWGLGPGERVAVLALLSLRDAVEDETVPDGDLLEARQKASGLVWSVRLAKIELHERFSKREGLLLGARAASAYYDIRDRLVALGNEFRELDELIEDLNGANPRIPRIADLVHVEIVQNAFSVGDPRVPLPFKFHFMSAGLPNALGHYADDPDSKLAGMKLGHFGGFIKHSWRANDWLWGRLDGVEHVLRALIDADQLRALDDDGRQRLAAFVFPEDEDLSETVDKAWSLYLADAPAGAFVRRAGTSARRRFLYALNRAVDEPDGGALSLELVRKALAARIQLEVLQADLARVAETARKDVTDGMSALASGASWADTYDREKPATHSARVALFRDLRIGEERPMDELSTRVGVDLGAQLVAVGVALISGARSGLPLGVARGALATLRGLTLAASAVIRLVAREPWVGAAACAVLAAVVIWGLLAPNAVLGALTATLAVLFVVVVAFLFAIVTSVLERPLAKRKRARWFLVLLGLPLAFALLAGWPAREAVESWFEEHVGMWPLRIAAASAALAALWALLSLVPRCRRPALAWYRGLTLLAVSSLTIGALARRWQLEGDRVDCPDCVDWSKIADERKGMFLVGILLVVFLATALVVEFVIPWRERRRTTQATP
jgi:predicted acylesterase/phospholipase RssA